MMVDIVNMFILFLMAVYVLQGVYSGALSSGASTASVGLSWIVAAGVSPFLARGIADTNSYSFLVYLTEVTDNVQDVEVARMQVASLSDGQVQSVIDFAGLPPVYSDALVDNMQSLAFAGTGYGSVADYLNLTIANVTVNIVAFLVIYVLSRVIFSLVINTMNYASPFPVLRRYDGLLGGVLGGVRAFFAMFAFAMLVPLVLALANVPEINKILTDSPLVTYFYSNNFLFDFIKGVL